MTMTLTIQPPLTMPEMAEALKLPQSRDTLDLLHDFIYNGEREGELFNLLHDFKEA